MQKLEPDYWEKRYQNEDTPWDIGNLSPAIQLYIDQIEDKSTRILIPGAGKAHEAHYLHQQGFTAVYVCDWAPSAFDFLKAKIPDFPADHLIVSDFFKLSLEIDLILEQTFFCAIDPSLRPKYVQKAAELLSHQGLIAGLLFATPFSFAGPPFGGTKAEYQKLFKPQFEILELDITQHSIGPRAGNELFFKMRKS